jgi:hypothetical protein
VLIRSRLNNRTDHAFAFSSEAPGTVGAGGDDHEHPAQEHKNGAYLQSYPVFRFVQVSLLAAEPDGRKEARSCTAEGIGPVVETVAGNGECCDSGGDGGPALSAALDSPRALAVAPDGSILSPSASGCAGSDATGSLRPSPATEAALSRNRITTVSATAPHDRSRLHLSISQRMRTVRCI